MYFLFKVNQLSCNLKDKAPPGCLQWFTGKTGVGTITNFNYANGYSLADQRQIICIRCDLCNLVEIEIFFKIQN